MKLLILLIVIYIIILVIIFICFQINSERNYWKRCFGHVTTCPFGREEYEIIGINGEAPSEAEGVISYSLFGNYERYHKTLVKSLKAIPILLPKWYGRVYVGSDIPNDIKNKLINAGGEVFTMGPNPPLGFEAALWRFLPAGELLPFVSLDADDLFNMNVSENILDWLNSELPFFVMTNQSMINVMTAGLWGARPFKQNNILSPPVSNIKELLNSHCEHWFGFDEAFLRHYIYPLLKEHGYWRTSSCMLREITIVIIIILVILVIISLMWAAKKK